MNPTGEPAAPPAPPAPAGEQDAAGALPLSPAPPRAITWRSVLLGLVGVVLICGLTPYNDYALNNTFLVGNNLPLAVMLLLFVCALFNGLLSRWAQRWALSSAEVTVAFSMALVSCALPSSGLMRYFPPSLVSPWYHAQSSGEFRSLADNLKLPAWLFPKFEGKRPGDWMSDPIVQDYIGRWTGDGPLPYSAWLRPALTWGVFLFALYGALTCMVSLVRRQWYENERLPFPLASIYLSLIEQPKPGRAFNEVLGKRAFWIAFFAVFLLHIWNGLAKYQPKYFPAIPVYYTFWNIFGERPWVFLDNKMKDAAVFFTVVGVSYFLSSSVAFSLWFFYVLRNLYQMHLGNSTGDGYIHGQEEMHFGSVVAFAVSILWVGRRHWQVILYQAFRGARVGEPRGRYLPYAMSFWGLVGCIGVMIGWLVLAGAGVGGATVMVLLLVLLFLVITRIVAEAGLVHGQLQVGIYSPWQMLATAAANKPYHPVSVETFYLGSLLQSVHYDFREVVPVYASHAMKVADQTRFGGADAVGDTKADRTAGRKLVALLTLALLVGYAVSFASTLWTEYKFAWSKDVPPKMPINDWGAYQNPKIQIVDATVQYNRGNYYEQGSQAGNWTFGFCLTSLLSILRLRFTGWPLHPVGFLMVFSFPGAHLWFSIMIGWLCKSLILRFGGPRLYVNAKPVFIGLIIGESVAAGFWLVMGIVLSLMDQSYRPVNIMPG